MASWEALEHLTRYLVHHKRLVWKFAHQVDTRALITHVDTDFAGCVETRRSTSGGACVRGGHLLKHGSAAQTTVALSSGEAELTGICKGSSIGLGLVSLAKDHGLDSPWKLAQTQRLPSAYAVAAAWARSAISRRRIYGFKTRCGLKR